MSKLRPIEGTFEAGDARITIIVSRWNGEITESLLRGALAALERQGVPDERVQVLRVPGAFELPLAALKVANTGRVDAVIALGCVIRGDTPHFDYVCGECTRGLGQVSLDSGLPVGFGLLTCDNLAQAQARAGDNRENKGEEAALTVLEMLSLLRQVR
ncbi:MAG: 6,7-dimethyl-8-ribityllumazine synthase [Bacteroidales bacterium]|nr:6,7-dimethyl-8-ribityllumazine synthase [Bacteroidales bacterium]